MSERASPYSLAASTVDRTSKDIAVHLKVIRLKIRRVGAAGTDQSEERIAADRIQVEMFGRRHVKSAANSAPDNPNYHSKLHSNMLGVIRNHGVQIGVIDPGRYAVPDDATTFPALARWLRALAQETQ